jgi:hypothetical protein
MLQSYLGGYYRQPNHFEVGLIEEMPKRIALGSSIKSSLRDGFAYSDSHCRLRGTISDYSGGAALGETLSQDRRTKPQPKSNRRWVNGREQRLTGV